MVKKIFLLCAVVVFGIGAMQPDGKGSKSAPGSPSGSRIEKSKRSSKDLSTVRDVLRGLTLSKFDEQAEQTLDERYEQIRKLRPEIRESVIQEILNSELYKGCGARLKFVNLYYDDRIHDLKITLENIETHHRLHHDQEKVAAVAQHHKVFYAARAALIQKMECVDSRKPIYMCEWDADEELAQLRENFIREIRKEAAANVSLSKN